MYQALDAVISIHNNSPKTLIRVIPFYALLLLSVRETQAIKLEVVYYISKVSFIIIWKYIEVHTHNNRD